MHSEAQLHSFIIKLWAEGSAGDGKQRTWSGQIRHVPDGAHRYIKSFDEMEEFITPYLALEKTDDGTRGLRGWIRRLRGKQPGRPEFRN